MLDRDQLKLHYDCDNCGALKTPYQGFQEVLNLLVVKNVRKPLSPPSPRFLLYCASELIR